MIVLERIKPAFIFQINAITLSLLRSVSESHAFFRSPNSALALCVGTADVSVHLCERFSTEG